MDEFKQLETGGAETTKFDGTWDVAFVAMIGPGTKIVGADAGWIDIVLP